MDGKGRKNAAGSWLRTQYFSRFAFSQSLATSILAFGLGYAFRDFFVPEAATWGSGKTGWAVLGLGIMAFGVGQLFYRRLHASYWRGFAAERWVGDVIEHAVARPGCAFAHDVKEALRGLGNVDHVVKTPDCIWVVETKAGWQDGRRFPEALEQVVRNVERVRRHVGPGVAVRGALVIADRWDRALNRDYDCRGETVKGFGPRPFWRTLREECGRAELTGADSGKVEDMVWNLGSAGHST